MGLKRALMILGLAVAVSIFVGSGFTLSNAEEKTIKVGAPDPLTGIYASDGLVMLEAAELAVADLNAQGGLLGRKLEVVSFDIEDMLPEKLISAAEVLVVKERSDFVVTACNAMGPDVQAFGKYDVPYIHNNASTLATAMVKDDPGQYWNVFQAGDNPPAYGSKTIEYYRGFGYKLPNPKVAVIYSEYDWDKEVAAALKKGAGKYNMDIVIYEQVPADTVAWGPILSKIRAHKPALIFLSIYAPEGIAAFADQFLQNPTNSLVDLGYAMSIPSFMNIAGKYADGFTGYAALAVPPGVTAEGRAIERRYKKVFNKDEMPISVVPCVYDAVMTWAAAVKRVGKVEDYRTVAKAIKEHPFKGMGGVYDFNNPQQLARAGDHLLPNNLFQAKSGKLVLRNLGSYTMSEYKPPPWIKQPWVKVE